MKKIAVLVVVIVLVVLAISAGVLYWQRLAPPSVRPDALLPADTLLLVEAANLPRSASRWESTELYKLTQEPEVQAFLEKPLATMPALAKAGDLRKDLVKLWPRQLFAAVVSVEGTTTKMIGGFSYAGNEKVAEAWLADARAKVKSAHPAGKADLVLHGKAEVVTYTDKDFVFAETTHKGWHFAANDLALLGDTLDRLEAGAKSTAPTLAGDAEYQKSFAALAAEPDLRLFARTGVFVDRLVAAASAGDPTQKPALEALHKTRALAAISKMEGGQIHDAVFTLGESEAKPAPLARAALELTDPDTAVFFSTQLGSPDLSVIPPELRNMLPFIGTLESALKSVGATPADLPAIFDSELSFIIPRPRGKMNSVLAIGLRDAPKAAKLAEGLVAPALGEQAWTASEEDGLKLYSAPATGGLLLATPPVLTLTDRYWLLSNSPAGFTPLLQRQDTTPQLDHTAAYRELAGSVVAPTQAFGYFDLGAIFDSYYGSLRPLMVIGMVGSEEAGRYIDAGKLPNAPAVSRHLGAFVMSQGAVADGTLWEARGNISAAQLILGAAGGYFASGTPLPAVPGLPGAVSTQTKATPAPAPGAPEPEAPPATGSPTPGR